MKKLLPLTLLAIIISVASYAQLPGISGPTSRCLGDSASLYETTPHWGSWTSSNYAICNVVGYYGPSNGNCSAYPVSVGSVTITFIADTPAYGSASMIFTVYPSPGTITGTDSVCVGATTDLTDAVTGGTWGSTDASVATVDIFGTVTGVAGGTVTIYYTTGGVCETSALVTVKTTTVNPVSGTFSVCVGSSVTVTDSTPSGTWSSSNPLIAAIGSATGIVNGIAQGTVTITYTAGCSSAYETAVFTVDTLLPAISGYTTICVSDGTTILSDARAGGTWSSSDISIAAVGSAGLVTGGLAGIDTIYYKTAGGCAFVNITVAGSIGVQGINPDTVCVGATATLVDSMSHTASGTWSSSDVSVATIGTNTGVVTGITFGATVITFTLSGTCGTDPYTAETITVVDTTTSPGTISGASAVTAGTNITLSETVSGGTWSSSNTAVATVGLSSGIVTGVSVGTCVITYSFPGCGGTITAIHTITVIPLTPINGISGFVNFSGSAAIKVWLITYNPSSMMLEAVDSVALSGSGTSGIYYQFLGEPTDSYRVKAAVLDTALHFVPTYHTSSYYWYSANVITHIAGTASINEDINIITGTVTTGPGFIAGNVTTGADKGTSGAIPVVGLSLTVLNSTTNQIMQSTITDIGGNYSFSNLPLGNYYVFPDSLNYLTTAYIDIALSTGTDSMTTADFTQHIGSGTITPNSTAVNNVNNIVSSVIVFPNPTNGTLNLQWNERSAEKGNVSITDITGREVYKITVSMNEGTGVKQIDLSGLTDGLYIISVKSGTINYNTKMQIQK